MNSVLLEKKDLGGSEQNTGNQEKVSKGNSAEMRLGGGGLTGQNSAEENLPPRYSLWRPPLGGDIRDEQIVKLNLLACKCKRLHKRISIDTVITIFCRGSHDMWTGTKLLLQRFSLSSKMRFPLLEVSSLNNWTTLEGVH